MSDKYWILGLLIILGITLFLMFTLPLMITVYGETREECVALNNTQVILIIEVPRIFDVGDCNWLVTEIIQEGKYELNAYTGEVYSITNIWLFLK